MSFLWNKSTFVVEVEVLHLLEWKSIEGSNVQSGLAAEILKLKISISKKL